MVDEPTTENKVAAIVNEILKAAIEGAGVKTIRGTLVASNPLLESPLLKQIFDYSLNYLGKYFYQQAAFAATKLIIDIQVDREGSDVVSAFQNLQMAVAGNDAEAIKKASDGLTKAYASLIHYDGSASP